MNIFDKDLFTAKNETFYLLDNTTIRQALEKFDYHKFSVVPIIRDDGTYVTTVSEGDILRYIKNHADFNAAQAENTSILDIEKYRPYVACRHNVSEEEIFKLALDQNFVPLIDDRGLFIGIIKRKNILNYFYNIKAHWE